MWRFDEMMIDEMDRSRSRISIKEQTSTHKYRDIDKKIPQGDITI